MPSTGQYNICTAEIARHDAVLRCRTWEPRTASSVRSPRRWSCSTSDGPCSSCVSLSVDPMHFNELRRGLPRMSPSLLSKRLTQLERAGLVDRARHRQRGASTGSPKPAAELRPMLEATRRLGSAVDRAGRRPRPRSEADDVRPVPARRSGQPCRTAHRHRVPLHRSARQAARLVAGDRPGGVDVCDFDPGHDITVTVRGAFVALIDFWVGNRGWSELTGSGALQLAGIAASSARSRLVRARGLRRRCRAPPCNWSPGDWSGPHRDRAALTWPAPDPRPAAASWSRSASTG